MEPPYMEMASAVRVLEFESEPVPVNTIEAAFMILEFESEPFTRVIFEVELSNVPALIKDPLLDMFTPSDTYMPLRSVKDLFRLTVFRLLVPVVLPAERRSSLPSPIPSPK
jgi:hypothetical protein